jgi:UDPglucose 6-dehydrogenase
MKVAFINEIADFCERCDGDVSDVARGIGMDARIGPAFLSAGPGYGGSCFPKDTRALAHMGERHSAPLRLVRTVIEENDRRVSSLADRVVEAAGGNVVGRVVALLGVAFKADTDDVRESPALPLLQGLLAHGAALRAHDPKAIENGRREFPNVTWCDDLYQACKDAEIVVIATDWSAYRSLDLRELRLVMAGDLLIDFRNLFRPHEVAGSGFHYVSVGRAPLDGAAAARLTRALAQPTELCSRRPMRGKATVRAT